MPYKRKEDKAAQMRRWRKKKKQQQLDFLKELRNRDKQLADSLRKQFPGLFPRPHQKKRKEKKE